jgi:hypothetical protein
VSPLLGPVSAAALEEYYLRSQGVGWNTKQLRPVDVRSGVLKSQTLGWQWRQDPAVAKSSGLDQAAFGISRKDEFSLLEKSCGSYPLPLGDSAKTASENPSKNVRAE